MFLMTFLEALILWILKKLKSERSVYAVFHLIKGKKSSQTIQDAYLYQIKALFYTFPYLKRSDFDECIQSLINKGLLEVKENNQYFLTNKGVEQINAFFSNYSFPSFLNGMKYQEQPFIIWNRLCILIQVLSNLVHDSRLYYPITRDTKLLRWVRQFILSQKMTKHQLGEAIYNELYTIFSKNPPESPEMFVYRLTGYNQIGKTVEQTADKLSMETTEYWFRFLHLLHYVVEQVLGNRHSYPILFSIMQDIDEPFPMTKSTVETYKLLLKNYTISEISKIRNLKESTIQDHIIEIALNNPEFSIRTFIYSDTEEKIMRIAKRMGKQKLKLIKEQLEGVSYFHIRLALAKNR